MKRLLPFRAWSLALILALISNLGLQLGFGADSRASARQAQPPPITSPETKPAPEPVTGDFSEASPPSLRTEPPPSPPRGQADSRRVAAPQDSFSPADSMEVEAERQESAKVYANPDGTRTAQIFSSPVHYRDAGDAWRDIDTRVVPDESGFKNAAGPVDVRFKGRADAPDLLTVTRNGDGVSLGLQGAGAVGGVASGSSLKYRGVAPGVDLEYHVLKAGVKELIVLQARPGSGSATRFRFPLNPSRVTPRRDTDGTIGFYDAEGNRDLYVPEPTVWDSAVGPNSDEPSYGKASLELSQEGDRWVLTLETDAAWLSSSERVYPIYLDPQLLAPTGGDSFVSSAYPNKNYNVSYNSALGRYQDKIGYFDVSTGTNWTYLFYDVGLLNGKSILSAVWNGYFIWSYYATIETLYRMQPVCCAWSAPSITWNNRPGLLGDYVDGMAVRNAWRSNDITDWVEMWTRGVWPNHGIAIHTAGNGTTHWKKLAAGENADASAPFLQVIYNSPPTVSAVSPLSGTSQHSQTPTLVASGSDSDGHPLQYDFRVFEDPNDEYYVWNSGFSSASSFTVPTGKLKYQTTYYWYVDVFDGIETTLATWRWTYTPSNASPPPPEPAGPTEGAVVPTSTPAFSVTPVTDPENDPVSYQFYVATGSDGRSGAVVRSGWISTATWTPPAGSLSDGVKYYWTAESKDSGEQTAGPGSVRSFQVDVGLGERSSSAFDSLAGVSVNLFNGNVLVATSSPTFKTRGGSIGVAYSYNSKKTSVAGLTGYYYNDDGDHSFDESPTLTRTDSQIHFSWGGGSPYPSIGNENFNVRWTGYVTVPYAGTYRFGTQADDGTRVWINDAQVLANWEDHGEPATPIWATSTVSASAGQSMPLRVEYYEHGGLATMKLWVDGPTGPGGAAGQAPVPASWFTTDLPGLPDGWSLSADPDGDLGYVFARISEGTAVLVDSGGATHSYRWNGSSWVPPPDADAVLGTEPSTGLLTLHAEDGRSYSFRQDGALASVASPLDDTQPAAPSYTWQGTPARLTKITDPVSGRSITLTYSTPQSACPLPPSGFTATPSYMLCKVDYLEFGGGETFLYYSNGHLARILDPGGEITDFGYDAVGKLTQVRDPLNNDLITSGAITDPASDTHKTSIAYDPAGVTAPTPAAGALRPQHTYDYQANRTNVHVAGALEPLGYSRQVTFDAGGRTTEERDAAGKPTTYVWDSGNRLVRKTDPTQVVTTNLYDPAGNLTDTYGPGSPGEFAADHRSASAPHSITGYDEGISGLAARWWDKLNLVGPPKTHATAGLQQDWGEGGPPGLGVTNTFSGRLTGGINLALAGSYGFAAEVGQDDGVRVYLDDRLMIDKWDPYREAVIRDAPDAYWRLGEAAGTRATDERANGYHGTYENGVVLGTAGPLEADPNTAVTLDGANDRVLGPTRTRPANSFAIEAWVRPTAAHEIDTEDASQVGGLAGQRYAFAPDHLGSEAGAGVSIGTNGISVYEHGDNYMPAMAVYQGRISGWAHVVINYVSKRPKVYLNGKLVHEGLTSTRTNVRAPLTVGWHDYGAFAGGMDEVAFYPKPLADERVRSHFEAGMAKYSGTTDLDPYRRAILQDGPLAYWRLAETSGLQAKDESPNQSSGTYQGGTTLAVPGALQSDANNAARFDGVNDAVSATFARAENSFTMEAWVRPTAAHEIDVQATSGTAGTSGQRYLFVPEQMGAAAGAGVSVGTNGVSVYEHGDNYMPPVAVFAGTVAGWNHVAVVYENKRALIYLNGRLVRAGDPSSRSTVFSARDVGSHPYGAFAGDVDEVAFHDYPLSYGDIASLPAGKGEVPPADQEHRGRPPSDTSRLPGAVGHGEAEALLGATGRKFHAHPRWFPQTAL